MNYYPNPDIMATMAINLKTEMANRIRLAFEASGLNRKQLAERSSVSYSTIWTFCAGTSDVALSTADRLCRVLGLTLTEVKPKPKGGKR